jgi:hypothetical protein
MFGIVFKSPAYLANRDIDVFVGFHKDFAAPQSFDNLVPGHHSVPVLDEKEQEFERQIFEVNRLAVYRKLMPADIKFESWKLFRHVRHAVQCNTISPARWPGGTPAGTPCIFASLFTLYRKLMPF